MYIEMSMPSEMHDLAKSTLPYLLPKSVAIPAIQLSTTEVSSDDLDEIESQMQELMGDMKTAFDE